MRPKCAREGRGEFGAGRGEAEEQRVEQAQVRWGRSFPGEVHLPSFAVHLERYRVSLAALIPEADYEGICLLDFEHWRADWNSSSWQNRERSVEFAGGNISLAKQQWEDATRAFMLATINETRVMRPGCKIGWYGYQQHESAPRP